MQANVRARTHHHPCRVCGVELAESGTRGTNVAGTEAEEAWTAMRVRVALPSVLAFTIHTTRGSCPRVWCLASACARYVSRQYACLSRCVAGLSQRERGGKFSGYSVSSRISKQNIQQQQEQTDPGAALSQHTHNTRKHGALVGPPQIAQRCEPTFA